MVDSCMKALHNPTKNALSDAMAPCRAPEAMYIAAQHGLYRRLRMGAVGATGARSSAKAAWKAEMCLIPFVDSPPKTVNIVSGGVIIDNT